MIQIFISLLALGFLDCLNPATVATLIILMPMVKAAKQATIFIWGTYVTYFMVGILFYYGIDKFIKSFVVKVIEIYSFETAILGVILGLIFFGIGVKLAIKVIKIIKKKEDIKDVSFIKIVNVNSKAIVGLSVISTLSDAPTAIPYIAFIGNLLGKELSFIKVTFLLAIYCILYVLPMVILYLSYQKLKERFESIEKKTKELINKASIYSIPIIALIGGGWIFIKALLYLLVH